MIYSSYKSDIAHIWMAAWRNAAPACKIPFGCKRDRSWVNFSAYKQNTIFFVMPSEARHLSNRL